jgi:hypothetical protein
MPKADPGRLARLTTTRDKLAQALGGWCLTGLVG